VLTAKLLCKNILRLEGIIMSVIDKVQNKKYLMKYFGNEPEVVYLGKSEIAEIKQYLVYSSEKVGSTDEDMLLGLKLICVDRETYLAVH
jgi:hypothetical protein